MVNQCHTHLCNNPLCNTLYTTDELFYKHIEQCKCYNIVLTHNDNTSDNDNNDNDNDDDDDDDDDDDNDDDNDENNDDDYNSNDDIDSSEDDDNDNNKKSSKKRKHVVDNDWNLVIQNINKICKYK